MFKRIFSFKGRIRRKEYGISYLICAIASCIVYEYIKQYGYIVALVYLPFEVFYICQGAKRCHDIGKGAGWAFIPLIELLLLFAKGDPQANRFGPNPRLSAKDAEAQMHQEVESIGAK